MADPRLKQQQYTLNFKWSYILVTWFARSSCQIFFKFVYIVEEEDYKSALIIIS